MLDVTAHTHVYGRPAGAWTFDACMKLAKAAKGVWSGTRGELVATRWRHGRGMCSGTTGAALRHRP